MTIGETLRETRRRHDLSQARLALRAGTAQGFISRVERGEVSPTHETLQRLFAAMGEELAIDVRRSVWQDDDVPGHREHASLSPGERIERALSGSAFAAELRRATLASRG
jgi:transcriptional regulator with XRE-family HTH domain